MALVNESVARVTTSQAFPLESPRIDTGVKAAPVRKFNIWTMWLSVIAAVAAFWFIASVGAKIDAANYRIDHLQSQIKAQTAENAALSAKVNQLKLPSRILQEALRDGAKYGNPVNIKVSTKH